MMTKNPLALGAGVVFMLFGAGLASFFGYYLFAEARIFKSSAILTDATIVEKEKKEITQMMFGDESESAGSPTTGTPKPTTQASSPITTNSTASQGATTSTTTVVLNVKYLLHYAFTPQGATEPVTGTFEGSERQFDVVEENQKLKLWYVAQSPKEQHRLDVPIKFGGSYYGGIGALFGGCLFIGYLGWCFIYPEEDSPSSGIPAAERKKTKRSPKKTKK